MATTATAPTPTAQPAAPQLSKHSRTWPLGMLIAVLAFFVLYHFVLPNASPGLATFVGNWLAPDAINEAIIWVIMALGLNIVVGYAGLLDLGYVAFWAIGGYAAGWICSPFVSAMSPSLKNFTFSVFGNPPPGQPTGVHLSFWIALPIAGLFCALWGIIIGAPTLRLKSDYLALVTLGFGEIIPEVVKNGDQHTLKVINLTNGLQGINPVDQIPLGVFSALPGVPKSLGPFNQDFKFLVFCLIAGVCIFISLRIREGRLGRAWLAIREDELAASMMGVPLMKTKLAAYAVGAFFGGMGGAAYAAGIGAVIPDRFDFSISITVLAMVVLGGMGNVWGVTIGALVIAWVNNTGLKQGGQAVNNLLGTSIDFPSWNFGIFGAILVLMMLFRREGLIPESRTRQVLKEPERGELEAVGADLEGEAQ
ncbi:MAG TPA: branched-chain amino acid ABC transporter permease [Kineosporiaceae bacterium]|nr:branched-chain amino acid ABC transporter permease [Kineosporiaceae bacterium]